jgi:NifB/MoaA-like Fe-S oxidoreductase
MTAKFLSEVNAGLADLPDGMALAKKKKSLIISGVSAEKINREVLDKARAVIGNLKTDVLAVVNEFFGATVTCTGLLTGQDILAALEKYRREEGEFDEVVLAGNVLKEFEDVFLCGMTLNELKTKLGFENVRVNRDGGYGFVEILSTNE